MAWKDELDNAKKIFKTGTLKEKLEYIFDYYKWHILILIFVIYAIGNIIYTNVTAKESVLQGIFLNTIVEESSSLELEQEFLAKYPIDSSSEEIFFDTSLYYVSDADSTYSETSHQTIQVLSVRIAAGEIDFVVSDLENIYTLVYNQYFFELPEVLNKKQLEKYEPYFLYYDKALLEELNNIDFTEKKQPEIVYPDPSKPELMKDPVPILIDIDTSERLSGIYPNSYLDYGMAFVVNSANTEKSLEFLDFLNLS